MRYHYTGLDDGMEIRSVDDAWLVTILHILG